MKKIITLIIILFVFSTAPVLAHPGKTDGNGCHTCRTDCEKWGLEYGEYHCHNDGDTSSYSVSSTQNNSSYSNNSSSSSSNSYSYSKDSDPVYNHKDNTNSEKVSPEYFDAKKQGVIFNTKTDFFIAITIYTAIVGFILLILFDRHYAAYEKNCNTELKNEKQKLLNEYNNKVKNHDKSYNLKIKNLNQVIKESADQKVLEYLFSRYKGQKNPYTGKIIESVDDIKDYLERYKENHKDDFIL
ncbi:YHYH domain-containing protein [Holdemania filiformis]|uniref:YHYH domain-containing protein n=1 Tax=Holdemania filiformis TaxID=61171 RepID=UPI0024326394|nr:YHYH domain-containing protein [Holdemania filiformis]